MRGDPPDVDMVELDVLPEHRDGSGRMLLAHDYADAGRRAPLTLEEGLDRLCTADLGAIELDVDLKLPGYELRALEALRERGLVERSLVSSLYRDGLSQIRAAEPGLRLGWSVPRVRRDWTASRLTILPSLTVLEAMKRALPTRAGRVLRAGEVDVLMAYWRLVTPRLVRAVHRAGGLLYAWTVDDPARLRAFEALGVDGIVTNRPGLFTEPV